MWQCDRWLRLSQCDLQTRDRWLWNVSVNSGHTRSSNGISLPVAGSFSSTMTWRAQLLIITLLRWVSWQGRDGFPMPRWSPLKTWSKLGRRGTLSAQLFGTCHQQGRLKRVVMPASSCTRHCWAQANFGSHTSQGCWSQMTRFIWWTFTPMSGTTVWPPCWWKTNCQVELLSSTS